MALKLPSLSRLSSLQQRIISAAIALPFFLLALFLGGPAFTGKITIIALIAGKEWLGLVTKNPTQFIEYLVYIGLAVPLVLGHLLGFQAGLFALFSAFILILALSYLSFEQIKNNPPFHIAAGVLYLGLAFLCVIWL